MQAARDRGGPDPSPAQINTQRDYSFWSAHFELRFLDGPALDVDNRTYQKGDCQGALDALARSRPGKREKQRDFELEEARAEAERLRKALVEIAVKLTLAEGEEPWG